MRVEFMFDYVSTKNYLTEVRICKNVKLFFEIPENFREYLVQTTFVFYQVPISRLSISSNPTMVNFLSRIRYTFTGTYRFRQFR